MKSSLKQTNILRKKFPHTYRHFHNSTQTNPSSPRGEDGFGHFLIGPPPALSFPSNQLQSVAGMEGEITLERHRGEISAQPGHYLVLPKHPGGNLRQTTRLRRVHTGQGGGWIEGHGRITDGLINSFVIQTVCLPVSVLLCYVSVCLPNSISTSQSMSVWLSYFHRLSLLSLSLSPSVSHCISVSITLPSFFHTCE